MPEDLLAAFEQLASQVRHPVLSLDLFVDISVRDGVPASDEELTDADVERRLDADAVRRARQRRGALLFAANLIFGRLSDDLIALADGTLNDDEIPVTQEHFPSRFHHAYDLDFHRKLLATTAKVALDLARPEYTYPACTAEELVLNAILREWRSLLEIADLADFWAGDLSEYLLEDLDFEYLFDDQMDGIEGDPLAHKTAGMDVRGVEDWFVPFNSDRVVHPYAVDLVAREAELYDLTNVDPDGGRELTRVEPVTSMPGNVSGLGPITDLVGLARAAMRESAHSSGLWIPDEGDAASSFAALLRLTPASGILTLQAGPGQEISEVPVLSFLPQPAHPSNGEPWAEVMYMSGRSELPLAAVVSFEVDPTVKARWQEIFRPLG